MAIVVELLSPSDRPLKHYIFEQNSVTIGRGFNNDLRLNDPYVCAEHVQIEKDMITGNLHFFNLKSINGVRMNGNLSEGDDLTANDVLTLGRTRLRVFFSDNPVAPTLKLGSLESNLTWLSHVGAMVAALVVCAAILLINEYISTIQDVKPSKLISAVLSFVGALAIWPLLMALLAKLAKKDSRIVSQFSLIFLFFVLFSLLRVFEKVASFNLPGSMGLDVFMFGLLLIVTFVFVWLSLFIAFHQRLLSRNLISLGLTILAMVPLGLNSFFKEEDFSSRPKYNGILLPPAYNLTAANSTEAFLADAEKLYVKADKLKQQKDN